jgi:hypothetical protein
MTRTTEKLLIGVGVASSLCCLFLIASYLLPVLANNCELIPPCLDKCPKKSECGPSCEACTGSGICSISWNQPVLEFATNVVSAIPPYSGFEPGTQHSASLLTADEFAIQNEGSWGTDMDSGLSVSDVGAVIGISSSGNPATRRITVTAFSADMAAFAHSAITPNTTGTNHFALDSRFVNTGTVTLQSGAVSDLKIHTLLTNAYYDEANAVPVVLNCSGSFNASTRRLQLTVDGFAIED